MWKQIIGAPNMDALVKKPDVLSFSIACKIPVSESTRQELLDIDGISYRLRREIELLESIDLIQCKICQVIIFNNPRNIVFFKHLYRIFLYDIKVINILSYILKGYYRNIIILSSFHNCTC